MTQTRPSSGNEQVLHETRPTAGSRFTQPIVVKQDGVFLQCGDDGDIRPGSEQGLYFHDMRYLSAETLRLGGMPPVSLLADAGQGHEAVFGLTNPDIAGKSGRVTLRKETLGIRRTKRLGDDYAELITVQNFSKEQIAFTLQLRFEADFCDMFVVRGMQPGRRGALFPARWHGDRLRFQYDGADDRERSLTLHFSRRPDAQDEGSATYQLSLESHERWELAITGELRDRREGGSLESRPNASAGSGAEDRERARQGALGRGAQVETDNPLFNDVLTRSLMDLHMLRMRQNGQAFFAAGVPWYVALFGRDSLITTLEVAALQPDIGGNTLRVLASLQGTEIDDWRDEQPGKILHELRVDEMANLDEIPQTPYYGSVDSTLLFLILLGVYSSWIGTLDLFHELRENVDAALRWIDEYGDSDGDGFVDYQTRSRRGGRNQGWKDSGNGIVMEDGRLAEPPIALPEVQGEVYLAWLHMADLFDRDGDFRRAEQLRARAQRLYEAFNQAFWLDGEGYYAFCRQADGRFSRSIASNPAHALWTGIVDPRRAGAVVQRVMQPDMFSGWGIRTLSSEDRSYNPVDYQLGSVWPHDNALIVAGMERYGFTREAEQVLTAMMQAATEFPHFRLPEVFAGYDRGFAGKPVRYPVACNPQAWAAGSIPFMLTSVLGLTADAFGRRLRIVHPHLPDWLPGVTVRKLSVGEAEVQLRYERSGPATLVAVVQKHGDLQVSIEP